MLGLKHVKTSFSMVQPPILAPKNPLHNKASKIPVPGPLRLAAGAPQRQRRSLLRRFLHQRPQRWQQPTQQGVAEGLDGGLRGRQGHGEAMNGEWGRTGTIEGGEKCRLWWEDFGWAPPNYGEG